MPILDSYSAGTIADALDEFIDDLGFPPEEAIPGLIKGIWNQAQKHEQWEKILMEAGDLLADGID
jgi:hypothetical protein